MRAAPLLIALALTQGTTSAQTTDFWRVLGDGGTALPGGDILYQLRSAAGITVDVALTFGNMDRGSGLSDLTVSAYKFRTSFGRQELQLFSEHVARLASQCFNLDPARAPDITTWIISTRVGERPFFQTVPGPSTQKSFGPLKLEMTRGGNDRAHSLNIILSRSGIPGQSPWRKTCMPSGG